MPHALVIDDHEQILQIVGEKLESLDHTFDSASSQEEAEEFLRRQSYDYILLDLAIPLRFGGQADKQYGRNLLHKIRGPLGHPVTTVIIMTANDLESYHVGVELMKEGADDFVGKPFGEDHPLERKIKEALVKRPPKDNESRGQASEPTVHPFSGAVIEFFEDRVEINGRKLTGRKSQMRSVLERLRAKKEAGGKITLGGVQLANECHFENGEKAAGDAVRQIRDKSCEALLKHHSIHAVGNDIVVTDDTGYSLGPKIQIRVAGMTPDEDASQTFSPLQLKILRELREKNNQLRTLLAKSLGITGRLVGEEIEDLLVSEDVKSHGKGSALRYELVRDPLPKPRLD
jgi:CheY-like chemotaxis protein